MLRVRALGRSLVVSFTVAGAFATVAFAVLPKAGARFNGTYKGAYGEKVSFKVAGGGRQITGFKVQMAYCGPVFFDPGLQRNTYFSVGNISVSSKGAFSRTVSKPFKTGLSTQAFQTAVAVKGKFTSTRKARGTLTVSQVFGGTTPPCHTAFPFTASS